MSRSQTVLFVTTLALGCRGATMISGPGPQAREITITTVPLLSHELTAIYPFLQTDFATGGLLEGKEVYAFSPSTIVVALGDTLHLELLNPEDDEHSFVLSDLYVPLPPMSRRDTTYVARRPGIFTFSCSIASHLPMMRGQLVVLSPRAFANP